KNSARVWPRAQALGQRHHMRSPEGAQEAFPDIAPCFVLSVRCEDRDQLPDKFLMCYKKVLWDAHLMCFPLVAGLAVRDTKSNRPASSSDRPLATSKCDDGKRKPAIHVSCRNKRWVKKSVLTQRLIATMK